MVKVILGEKGSGNTKELVEQIHAAVEQESGNVVCIENGTDLTYDVNYRVRLIDITHYGHEGYSFLKGFLAGLHGGNFDITHIFIDSLYKVSGDKNTDHCEEFLNWCKDFGEINNVKFTISVTDNPQTAPYGVRIFAED